MSTLGDTRDEDLARIDRVLARMASDLDALSTAGDRAEVFLFTYRLLTLQMREHVAARRFADPHWLTLLAIRFADLYFAAADAYGRDRTSCPAPWARFFDAAERRDVTAPELLLLGMNAHIVHDLALAIAAQMRASGDVFRGADGAWVLTGRVPLRQFDHELVNEILKESTDLAQDQLAKRYGFWMRVVDVGLWRLDEWLIDRLLRKARTQVWTHGVALAVARDDAEQDAIRRHLVAASLDNVRRLDFTSHLPPAARGVARRLRRAL